MNAIRSDVHPGATSPAGGSPGRSNRKRLAYSVLLALVSWLYLLGIRLANEFAINWTDLAVQFLFICIVLLISQFLAWGQINSNKVLRSISWVLLVTGVISAVAYIIIQATFTAWLFVAFIFILLLRVDAWLTSGQKRLTSFILHLLLCIAAGGMVVAIAQIESRFSDEEFLALQQVILLAILWLLLLAADRSWSKTLGIDRQSPPLPRRLVSIGLVVMAIAVLIYTLRAYQASFYPAEAPGYSGISTDQPFLCGRTPPNAQTYDGLDVYQRLLALVEANPNKGSPEYGELALATGEDSWAQGFRQALIEEARQGLFTQPAKSIKYGQCLAAQRAYYYPQVIKVFPNLFTADETQEITKWFQAINRRALTVEPVDWFYALAFSQWPVGPYENQECGAGLLSTLEAYNLADPALSTENQQYLDKMSQGWLRRFRNTDDAYIYQVHWLQNAYYQYLYNHQANPEHERLSWEWFLIQSLPDASPLTYNHIGSAAPEQTAYWGAAWLQDPVFLWLAGRSADILSANGKTLSASPGMEAPISITGVAPAWGSCLLYGDSGLPNQLGPLAPDKIVFREGWDPESAYLLLNLRFTGWHRYKATNSVSLIYQSTPLVSESSSGDPLPWLPEGRALLRDKRILREDLNGLLVERTGMSSVLQKLTAVGGPWAQDPPFYAQVLNFETTDTLDTSTTLIEDWRGWRYSRKIFFFHPGPIVILDKAETQKAEIAGLVWHVEGEQILRSENRIKLHNQGSVAEMVVIPLEPGYQVDDVVDGKNGLQVMVRPRQKGSLAVATVFLLKDWAGATVSLHNRPQGKALVIDKDGQRIEVPVEIE